MYSRQLKLQREGGSDVDHVFLSSISPLPYHESEGKFTKTLTQFAKKQFPPVSSIMRPLQPIMRPLHPIMHSLHPIMCPIIHPLHLIMHPLHLIICPFHLGC